MGDARAKEAACRWTGLKILIMMNRSLSLWALSLLGVCIVFGVGEGFR